MVCIVLAIFDRADETQKEVRLLRELSAAGMVDIYSLAVVSKDRGGSVKVNQGGDYGGVGALVGLVVGSLVGLLAGPAGIAVGAACGALTGWWVDRKIVGVTVELVDIVARYLSPGQSALVTELEDDSLHVSARPV